MNTFMLSNLFEAAVCPRRETSFVEVLNGEVRKTFVVESALKVFQSESKLKYFCNAGNFLRRGSRCRNGDAARS